MKHTEKLILYRGFDLRTKKETHPFGYISTGLLYVKNGALFKVNFCKKNYIKGELIKKFSAYRSSASNARALSCSVYRLDHPFCLQKSATESPVR